MTDRSKSIALSLVVLAMSLLIVDRCLPLLISMSKPTLESDPLLGLRGRPELSTIWTNEVAQPIPIRLNRYGFHDAERSMQKRPGTFRIISLGDSFVEAYQVPLEKNFSQLLEQELNRNVAEFNERAPRRIEVCNQGIHGYGLGVYYLYVEHRVDAWSPDLVLLTFFLGNDFTDNYHPFTTQIVPSFELVDGGLRYYPPHETFSTWLRDNVLVHSNIAVAINQDIVRRNGALVALARNNGFVSWAPGHALSDGERREILAIARLQLRGIKEYLSTRHIGLFVLVIPDPKRVQEVVSGHPNQDVGSIDSSDRIFLERGLLNILEAESIPHEYPLSAFVNEVRHGHEVYIQGIGHLTPEGHRQVAGALAGQLHQIILQHTSDQNSEEQSIYGISANVSQPH